MGRSPNGQHTLDFDPAPKMYDPVAYYEACMESIFDPVKNAQAAVALYKKKEKGLSPWTGTKFLGGAASVLVDGEKVKGVEAVEIVFDEYDTIPAGKTWKLDGVKVWEITLGTHLSS